MLQGPAMRQAAFGGLPHPVLPYTFFRQFAAVLLAAALAETLLLRLVIRTGVHMPKEGAVRGVFESASLLGSLAFNLASLLAIALAALLLASMVLRLGSTPGALGLTGLSLAMFWGLGQSLATDAPAADALFGVATTLLVGLIGLGLLRRQNTPLPARMALVLIVAAYFCYQYYALGHLFFRLLDYTAVPPSSVHVLRLGEGLAVVAGGAVFWAWGLPLWRRAGSLGVGAVAALLVGLAVAALTPVSTTAILALWTAGLSLFLPYPLYLLSLGLFLLTLVACWCSGDGFWTAAGLLLVLLAGYMPEATYQHLLMLLGVIFLSGAVQWAASPAPASASLLSRRA